MKVNAKKGFPIKHSCKLLGYARSSYYKSVANEKKRRKVDQKVIKQVKELKTIMPNIGGRKIHYLLKKTLLKSGHTSLGRDRLFELLKQNDLLVKRKKKNVITTNSNHPFRKHQNLIKSLSINRVNQVWVSDITYLKINEGFCYLSLITDVFSRKIVGYHINDSLELKGVLKAFKYAVKSGVPQIHHSDRGSQYCSYKYTNELKKHQVKISMTQDGNCYDNAIAERINGILKNEFNLDAKFNGIKNAKKAVKQAVDIYNSKRPHWSIELKIPDQVYYNKAA